MLLINYSTLLFSGFLDRVQTQGSCKHDNISVPPGRDHIQVISSSEDVVHHVFVRDKYFVSDGAAAKSLPRGCGILKTSSGKVLYSGEWCKGKCLQNGRSVIVLMCFLSFYKLLGQFQITVERNYAIAIAKPSYWLKNLAPVFQPLRSKTRTKANRTMSTRFFPSCEQVTGNR